MLLEKYGNRDLSATKIWRWKREIQLIHHSNAWRNINKHTWSNEVQSSIDEIFLSYLPSSLNKALQLARNRGQILLLFSSDPDMASTEGIPNKTSLSFNRSHASLETSIVTVAWLNCCMWMQVKEVQEDLTLCHTSSRWSSINSNHSNLGTFDI